MEGLNNMTTRINFNGGKRQVDRMNLDKLKSLKKALIYSYQSATAILQDGKEFRCLINRDKLKEDYDDKTISIPFEDICLNEEKIGTTTQGIQKINIKPGDVFTWKENNTNWLVLLQKLEETAYFRASIRRCRFEIEVNDNKYKVYACGPREESIVWNKVNNTFWNDLNYTLEMYITKDEITSDYFHRFSKIKLNGKNWEVQAVDDMSIDGVIAIALKEDYQNSIEEAIKEEEKAEEENKPIEPEKDIYISGNTLVYPYEEASYSIVGTDGGDWLVDNSKVKIMKKDSQSVTVGIMTGRSGEFNLIYRRENEEDIVLEVIIDSL